MISAFNFFALSTNRGLIPGTNNRLLNLDIEKWKRRRD
jgi:hypothetical protein